MRKLHIDIETFCELDLSDVGVHKYAQHESFRIILFAYRWNDGPIHVIDCYDDKLPATSLPLDILDVLTEDNPDIEIWAHNANFEYTCISNYYKIPLRRKQWRCTMIAAAYLGLPLGLDHVSKVLALSEQKDNKGKALISFFCMPCKPTKKNKGATINLPSDYPEKWQLFKDYNGQDVRVECEIEKYISRYPGLPDWEQEYWLQDQQINEKGIMIDKEFVQAAIRTNDQNLTKIHEEIKEITGLENPNSLSQLKNWIFQESGVQLPSLSKTFFADLKEEDYSFPDNVKRVLALRQLSNKSSSSKYDTMLSMCCNDDRIRGLFQFYGANRTGRAAGRGVQPQNLKKTFSNEHLRIKAPHLIDDGLDTAREAIRYGIADMLYDDVSDIISKLVRTSFISSPGKSFVVADFSAIEARVLAWIAGEEWVLDVFRTHGKIYEATAANMFNVPIDMVTKGSNLRAKGKVASLALGYQGASGALINMGALREGLMEGELPAIVQGWRSANPKIVKLWRTLESAAKHVIEKKSKYTIKGPYCDITFSYEKGYLFTTLPSGRRLAYYGASVLEGKIQYMGLDQVKKIWTKMYAYGGLLAENITQAIARDCLYYAMYELGKIDDMDILMHVHDEIVSEANDQKAEDCLEQMLKIMSSQAWWAQGLPLKGEGYISKFYRKD